MYCSVLKSGFCHIAFIRTLVNLDDIINPKLFQAGNYYSVNFINRNFTDGQTAQNFT